MILGIYGYQDSGKTTLVEDLVRTLVRKGYRVASVKHTPHMKSIDCEGKDTWKHWKAGSDPVVFSSATETSLIWHRPMPPGEIARLVMDEFHPDVLLVEGGKGGLFPKVAIGDVKPRRGTVMSNPALGELTAYIEREVAFERTRRLLPGLDCGKCGLDCDGLARAVAEHKRKLTDCRELSDVRVEVKVDGIDLPMGRFASDVVDSTVRGLLTSLKGYSPGCVAEIRLSPINPPPKRRRH